MITYTYELIKRGLAIFLLISTVFFSCNDEEILQETPLDFLAPGNAYTSVAGVRQGISGLHAYCRNYLFRDGSAQEYFAWRRGVGTDIAYHGEDPASTKFPCDFITYFTSSCVIATKSWENNYKIIQYANVLIENIDISDAEIWENDAQKEAYKAEAMFFRAYAYRELVSCFGDIPLVTEAIKTPKVDFVRAPMSEIYALMEADLSYGTTHLPKRGEEDPGRITQAAAWHFLAETYIAQDKNEDGITAATHVIEDYGHALMTSRFGSTVEVFGTGDVYLDLHAYGNQNMSTNTEGIWIVQYEPLIEGGSEFLGERGFGPAYFRMGNTPDGYQAFLGELYNGSYTGYSDTLSRPVAWIRPSGFATNTIWERDWSTDYRNASHQIKRKFYYNNPSSIYDKKEVDFDLYSEDDGRDPIKDTCQYIFPYYMKFADPLNHFTSPNQSGGGQNHKDYYGLRLAETYLLRAEAYINTGKNENAKNDINMVRTRSNASAITTSEVTIDFLLDERARELYGEEQRQITLRRMGKLVERVKKYNDNPKFPGLNIEDYHTLLPIPQTQIDLNIGAVIEQNPNY